ncbi:hypothetical protein [Sphingobacterium cellulitidis]|uniref:hypothetical protein n=1 Tax=Sphingobacterium cellulitidis TaxID=1768011 RepID=UPI003C7E973A
MEYFDINESHGGLAVGVAFTAISISKIIPSEIKGSTAGILNRLSINSQLFNNKKK